MDIKLNLPKTKCCDWNDLFSQRYHRMFRVSDLDEWGIKEQSIQLIKKQVRNSKDPQSLEIDGSQYLLPEKKTLAIRGLGYWIGSLQWDRKESASQNTVISAVISKYWLSAPIAVAGLALALWYFKGIFNFLKPIGEYGTLFWIVSILLVLGIGALNYFVHYLSIKNILKQLTVFLKYKGVSYEFGDDVFNAEKAFEEARLEYEKNLRELQRSANAAKPGIMTTETVTSDYVPQTIADKPSAAVMQTQIDDDFYQVDPETPAGSDMDMVTEQFDTAIDSELYATAIAEENATERFVEATVDDEEATEYFAPTDNAEDSEAELPVVEEITEEFGDGFGDDLDFDVPNIDEEGTDAELMVENKDLHDPKSEKIKLMADSALQTQDMRMDDFDSEIEGGLNAVDDSAFALGMDEGEDFDSANATQIDDFGAEILSPDDAFAQGFSPQVMPEEEFAMDDIVADGDDVEIDNNFEVPEINEEAEEIAVDDLNATDDFDEESEVEIADMTETVDDIEQEISEEMPQEQLDEYKIEVDEEDGFDEAFDSSIEQDAEIEESSDFVQHDDTDEQALTEISEMTDSFAVPEIAEGFTKSPEDVNEPEIPDDFMVSEITEDMGLTDEEIAEAQGGDESAFDLPEVGDEEKEDEMVIPEDFMVPEIEEEDDGFADATEYIVQDFAGEDNETNIESYGDGFQEEEDVDEEEVTPEDMEAIFGKEETPYGAQDDDEQQDEEMGSFDGFDDDADVSEDGMIDPQDEDKISFSDDDFAEPEVQEDSVVDVEAIIEDEDFGDVTEYTEDFVAPEIELEEDDEEEWKDWD